MPELAANVLAIIRLCSQSKIPARIIHSGPTDEGGNYPAIFIVLLVAAFKDGLSP